MELLNSAGDVFFTTLVLIAGLFVGIVLRRTFAVSLNRLLLLYVWHGFFCVIYALYAVSNGADALVYFEKSLGYDDGFSVGTQAVTALTSLFSDLLGLPLLAVFLVFNIFGFVGLLAFDGAVRFVLSDASGRVRFLGSLIVFLPSISFWSSAIGKDAIAFMSAGLALWAALHLKRRIMLMIFAVLVMLLVRPHIAAAMLVSFVIGYLLSERHSVLLWLSSTALAVAGAFLILPFAISYAGLTALDPEALSAYVDQRQSYNQRGGGGIDISSMSFPVQMFTYLFRPLPFEARSLFQFAAALDNMVLLGLCVFSIRAFFKSRQAVIKGNVIFMMSFSIICWVMLAITTANLGIAVRQKWMFLPMLIVALLAFSQSRMRTPPVSQANGLRRA
mgnify:CR=1 FL=1